MYAPVFVLLVPVPCCGVVLRNDADGHRSPISMARYTEIGEMDRAIAVNHHIVWLDSVMNNVVRE